MPAEGVAVGKVLVAVPERLRDAITDEACPDGGVAARHALGARNHVRHVTELVAGEGHAEAPKSADHFVGHQQHVVLVADLAYALEIPGWRREASSGVLHRFQEPRGNRVR